MSYIKYVQELDRVLQEINSEEVKLGCEGQTFCSCNTRCACNTQRVFSPDNKSIYEEIQYIFNKAM